MQGLTLSLVGLLVLVSAPTMADEAPHLGRLVVKVEGLTNSNGQVMIALEKTPEAFDKGPINKAQYRGEYLPIKDNTVVAVFEDVPFGVYAIKAFHDENLNSDLDKNLMGIPTEDYGFSNDARGAFGPPKFEAAKFQLGTPELNMKITLK